MSESQFRILAFYVPEPDLEKVLSAVFDAGAGKYRAYDRCAWVCRGEGRFRSLEGSRPAIGKSGTETRLPEVKVECIVPLARVESVRKALLQAHPYEEPAYHFIVTDTV
jgi:hypothetical protein